MAPGRAIELGGPHGRLTMGLHAVPVRWVVEAVNQPGSELVTQTYTAAEWRLFRDRPQSLAGRWAAKRAAASALGVDLDGPSQPSIAAIEIEVLPLPSGQPTIQLSGAAAARAVMLGLSSWLVSITHTRDIAVASVVACGDTAGTPSTTSGDLA